MSDNKHSSLIIIHLPSRRFKWDTVTTFSQNEEVHSLAVNDLVTQLERANISCTATITFGEANFKDQLTLLRVITESFHVINDERRKSFCVVNYKALELHLNDHQTFLPIFSASSE